VTQPEVAIQGAGPVGCALALALERDGRRVALVARAPRTGAAGASAAQPSFRPLALSQASRLILERIGVWPRLAATPIETIHVSQAGGFGRVLMAASDAALPALGYVVDYGALAAALRAQVEARAIPISEDDTRAKLRVHAEGAAADADEKPYRQQAVLALVATQPRAGRRAFERFRSEGPLALLPCGERYGVVWVVAPARARELLRLPEASFLEALARAFGTRAGRFESVSELGSVPLALRRRASRIGVREAYVGNAAQTLHPVAGQGLNVGLRDAWELSRSLRGSPDPGVARLLERYAARRRLDAAAAVGLTDFLASAFREQDAVARAARGAALAALDACAPLRRFFARRMIFGPSALP
jgi:2-octaprenyl-6-methoxyphenol hydroxylase